MQTPAVPAALDEADLERRFGGLRRLYGAEGYGRIRAARVAVVGTGGVGSWAAEALARCGVAGLVLIDYDHVAESNVNRQIHALSATLGQAKVLALRERIEGIHPGCAVEAVDAFVTPEDWPAQLPHAVDVVIDACDDPKAKFVLACWALRGGHALVTVGAAGGKQHAQRAEIGDLAHVTHDPLLAQLRQRLRREGLMERAPAKPSAKPRAAGLACVFSREAVQPPIVEACAPQGAVPGGLGAKGDLSCHGYGSVVTVTATFGLLAADAALHRLVKDAFRG